MDSGTVLDCWFGSDRDDGVVAKEKGGIWWGNSPASIRIAVRTAGTALRDHRSLRPFPAPQSHPRPGADRRGNHFSADSRVVILTDERSAKKFGKLRTVLPYGETRQVLVRVVGYRKQFLSFGK